MPLLASCWNRCGRCDRRGEMEVSLDVSMLEPCEPLDRTLESVEQLKEGD